MNPGKIVLTLATLAFCFALPIAARAENEAEKKQQAKEHYERATRLYDVGKYGEAIAEYNALVAKRGVFGDGRRRFGAPPCALGQDRTATVVAGEALPAGRAID